MCRIFSEIFLFSSNLFSKNFFWKKPIGSFTHEHAADSWSIKVASFQCYLKGFWKKVMMIIFFPLFSEVIFSACSRPADHTSVQLSSRSAGRGFLPPGAEHNWSLPTSVHLDLDWLTFRLRSNTPVVALFIFQLVFRATLAHFSWTFYAPGLWRCSDVTSKHTSQPRRASDVRSQPDKFTLK